MLIMIMKTVIFSAMIENEDSGAKSMFFSSTNDERVVTPASVEEIEKIDRMNRFFKTKQSFTIKDLLRDKLLERMSSRGKGPEGSKDQFPVSKYGLTSPIEIISDEILLGKDKFYFGKQASVSPKEHSYGKYSKGRKIMDKEETNAQPNKENVNLTTPEGKISTSGKNMKILRATKNECRTFKQPLERSNSNKRPRSMTPDCLPDLSYFLSLNVSVGESSMLSLTPRSSNSITSLNLMDVDSVLENFDSDIFDDVSNILPVRSEDKTTSKPPKTQEYNKVAGPSTFNITEKWEIYEGIYKNFRMCDFNEGSSFSLYFRICKAIDICERHRLPNSLPVLYKFNYFVNFCDQYLANSQKKNYVSLEDLKDKKHLDDFEQSAISLAYEYQNISLDVNGRMKKIVNLYFRKIKNYLEIYSSINIEIQRSKCYKYFLPELSVIEIILLKKNIKAKATLLKTYGLLIIINHLARQLFTDECSLLKMIQKYNESRGEYLSYTEKIYCCYQNMISIKGKNSPVLILMNNIGYDPTLRYLDLFAPIILTLDIMHLHTGMNIVKLITHIFEKDKNFLETVIQDRYMSLELLLSLSLVLYNDTVNHQLDADEGLLIWFRSYIETFGSQLNFLDIFDCLRYMAGEVIGV